MAEKLRKLTIQEKVVLSYAFFESMTVQEMYAMCHDTAGMSSNVRAQQSRSSSWYNSDAVAAFRKDLQSRFNNRVQAEVDARVKVARNNPDYVGGTIDFTNLDEFLAEANKQANLLNDEKDKQFYLKTIADLMRFKEGAQDKNQDIQRFYTPLLCRECPLHIEAEKGLKGKG